MRREKYTMAMIHVIRFCIWIVCIILLVVVSEIEPLSERRLLSQIHGLEVEMRNDNANCHKEISHLRHALERMERLWSSLPTDMTNIPAKYQDISEESIVTPDMKFQENQNKKSPEYGYHEGMKHERRLRRQISEQQEEGQPNNDVNVIKLSNQIDVILDSLKSSIKERLLYLDSRLSLSNDLKEIKADVKHIKESIMNLKNELNITKNVVKQVDDKFDSCFRDSNDTKIHATSGCNESVEIMENKQIKKCEENQPMSCLEVLNAGCNTSDVYQLSLANDTIKVYCDQETDSGGWIVFQRRQNGSVDFYRNWTEYRNGFGSLDGDFWLGNENVNQLLSQAKTFELRIDLVDFEDNKAYAGYSSFMIAPELDGYRLTLGSYSGDAGDSLEYHNGETFVTKDRDNAHHCARARMAGWWFDQCNFSNLNGVYYPSGHTTDHTGITWYHWKGWTYSLKFVEMKFRETK